MIVLMNKVMEVAGYLRLSLDRLPKRTPDRLHIIPIENISPTRFPAYEKKFASPMFKFTLFFDGRYETLLIVETVPPKVPGLT